MGPLFLCSILIGAWFPSSFERGSAPLLASPGAIQSEGINMARSEQAKKRDKNKAAIIKAIAGGIALREYCRGKGTPARAAVHQWLIDDKDFADQYARAMQVRADEMFDEILDIADQYDPAKDKTNPENVQRAKLRIDTRKWKLGKMQPQKYGDKLDVTSDGKAMTERVIMYERKPDWVDGE